MNKRKARKAALKLAARWTRLISQPDIASVAGEEMSDQRRLLAELTRIADHLEWEAAGRPERP